MEDILFQGEIYLFLQWFVLLFDLLRFFFSHQDFIPEHVFILWDLSSFQISNLTPVGFSLKSYINMHNTVYFFSPKVNMYQCHTLMEFSMYSSPCSIQETLYIERALQIELSTQWFICLFLRQKKNKKRHQIVFSYRYICHLGLVFAVHYF